MPERIIKSIQETQPTEKLDDALKEVWTSETVYDASERVHQIYPADKIKSAARRKDNSRPIASHPDNRSRIEKPRR